MESQKFAQELIDFIYKSPTAFHAVDSVGKILLACGYKEIFENAGGHGGVNLPKSQAYKDATMAYFILKNWSAGKVFLHYNGAYHSNRHLGIEWYLKQQNPGLKIFVISSVEQKDNSKLENDNLDLADFTICIPASMTKTYR